MKNNLLSRQKKTIIILSSLALVLLIAYLLISLLVKDPLNTVLKYDEDGDALYATLSDKGSEGVTTSLILGLLESGQKSKYDVKPGETDNVLYTFRARNIDISYRPFITPEVAVENLKSVEVSNSYGTYKITRNANGSYILDNQNKVVFDSSAVSSLILQARFMLAGQKVENASQNLSDYGLSDADKPIKISVTDTSGKLNTILLGNKSVDGKSYYMKHTQKPYIYVMDSSVSVFENPAVSLLSPILEKPMTEQEYNYMDTFTLRKNGEDFVKCVIVPEEQATEGSTNLHKMTYPANYTPSITSFYEALSSLASPKGSYVVEYAVSDKPDKEALFDYYGLTVPSNDLEYSKGDKKCHFITGNSFNDQSGGKVFYAYSEYSDMIIALPLSSMPFLDYTLIDFVDNNVFRYSIDNVSSITVLTPAGTKTFDLAGSKKDLCVTERQSAKSIDVQSFRQMYISLLSVTVEGYAETNVSDGLTHDLTFTVETKFGDKNTYSFYTLSTLKCLINVNGKGEFYTNRAFIDKIAKNVDMLMSGQEIKADY